MNVSARQAWLLKQIERFGPDDLRLARYHVAQAVEIAPTPDIAKIEMEVARLYASHEALRWTFHRESGGAHVAKLRTAPPGLTCRAAPDDDAAFQAAVLADARARFDLAKGPLFEIIAYPRPGDRIVLLLRAHHLIVDGASLIILMRALLAGVFGLEIGYKVGRPYADFVAWQRAFLRCDDGARLLDRWLAELSDLPPPLALPYDTAARGAQPAPALKIQRTLDSRIVDTVRRAATSLGVGSFRIYLAAYVAMMFKLTGARDIPVSLASAARSRVEFLETVGWFNDTIVVREPIEPGDTFATYAARLSARLDSALENDGLPLHLIVEQLEALAPNQATCLDEVAFSMIAPNPRTDHDIGRLASTLAGTKAQVGAYTVQTWPVPIPYASPHQVSFRILERPDTTYVSASFNATRFVAATAERLTAAYEGVLDALAANPHAPLDGILAHD